MSVWKLGSSESSQFWEGATFSDIFTRDLYDMAACGDKCGKCGEYCAHQIFKCDIEKCLQSFILHRLRFADIYEIETMDVNICKCL